MITNGGLPGPLQDAAAHAGLVPASPALELDAHRRRSCTDRKKTAAL